MTTTQLDLKYFQKFITDRCAGAEPLFITKRGSHAYGTNIETSDEDFAGVYIQKMDDILGTNYKPQLNDDKNDTVFYEVRRFVELLATANPTMIELLNSPQDCILYIHPSFQEIINNKDVFITKGCKNSFGGYARQQISKAKGQNKKVNWEKDKVERKTPLDFCYMHEDEKSISLTAFLSAKGLDQRFCGLSKLPHSKDMYALFYDFDAAALFSEYRTPRERKRTKILFKLFGSNIHGFKGIIFEDSNDVRLSSIPKNCDSFIGHISYNKDGYSQHCVDYKSYQDWLANKNEARYVDVKSHGQKIDGKNMLHCQRLLTMAKEIAEGKGVIVRRPDAEYLISIRRGAIDLQELIDRAENTIKDVDRLFDESALPDNVSESFINDLILKIRKQFYEK